MTRSDRVIPVSEIESLAGSPFAKEKAGRLVQAALVTFHVMDEEGAETLEAEHAVMRYRLVGVETLRDIAYTIRMLSDNYRKLMEEAAPLILEAAKEPGNKWNNAMRLLGEAAGWDAENL